MLNILISLDFSNHETCKTVCMTLIYKQPSNFQLIYKFLKKSYLKAYKYNYQTRKLKNLNDLFDFFISRKLISLVYNIV